MQPFSITLFATTDDPEGIRHVDKPNWSDWIAPVLVDTF